MNHIYHYFVFVPSAVDSAAFVEIGVRTFSRGKVETPGPSGAGRSGDDAARRG